MICQHFRSNPTRGRPDERLWSKLAPWVIGALVVTVFFALAENYTWMIRPKEAMVLPLELWINEFMEWVMPLIKPAFRAANWLLTFPMTWLQDLLSWLPWSVTMVVCAAIAWAANGWKLTIGMIAAMSYMLISGYWSESMNTLALVLLSTPLAVVSGLFLGIAASRSRIAERVVMSLMDLMQTFPTFSYLVPILFLFGFGPVVGLITSAIYAIPPMARNTLQGLRNVPTEVIEAALMAGTTKRQLMWRVKLPTAMPSLLIGINQTTMAALSMVIIAAVIGGSADIGWEVVTTMRKADFGASFSAGIVIALMAMLLDRVTGGFARTRGAGSSASYRLRSALFVAAILSCGVALTTGLFPILNEWPQEWILSLADPLDSAVNWLTTEHYSLLNGIKTQALYYLLLPLRIGFIDVVRPMSWGFELTPEVIAVYWFIIILFGSLALWRFGQGAAVAVVTIGIVYFVGASNLPWPLFITAVAALAWRTGGPRLAAGTILGLIFILFTGFWPEAMLSVYLTMAAVAVSFILGSALGILAATNRTASAVLRPICDTLQTMPLFVFLIPAVMLFQVGEFSALIAIVIYAIVPAIRYTEHGIRSVDAGVIEAARMQGATNGQILRQVQLPLALPQIALGLNQVVMFSLAMLVIAALVGTRGLAAQTFNALSAGNLGMGVIAGIGITILAIIIDRIIQSWVRTQKNRLGLV
ncbi:MAG: ABC transporter permease subunit [Rhodospirillaceae bacterium]